MIDKEFLEGVGVTDAEAVEKITSAYTTDMQAQQTAADYLKQQLADANDTIKSYQDMDIEGIKQSAAEWQQKAEQAEADRKAFEHRTKLAAYVKGLHLKDDIYEAHVTKLLEEKGFDVTDADTAERYDAVKEKLRTAIPECSIAEIGYAPFIRTYCKAHRAFYDTVFGEPVSEKIFANIPDSIRKYNAVYAKFLAFVEAQGTDARNEIREVINKYKPKGGKK